MAKSSKKPANKKPPRRSNLLKVYLADLERAPAERYVKIQRERGQLITIDKVDIDMEQMVERSFLCDRHRCIQWTPHEKKAKAKPLIDNSCCSRYTVPVSDLDRDKLAEILPLVRKRLAPDHPLNSDENAAPYQIDDDYAFAMHEEEDGTCQFVLYEAGQTTCAIHKTCLEENLDVWTYKPLGCSLWPLAVVDYEVGGETRYLLTIYSRATANMFEQADDESDDEAHFACLVDQDPDYDPIYRSLEGVITHIFGADFYRQLDRQAQAHLRR